MFVLRFWKLIIAFQEWFLLEMFTGVSFFVTPITSLTGPVPTTNTVSEVTIEATTGATVPLTTSEPETTTPLVDSTTTREESTTSTETNSTPPNTPPATSPDAGIPTTTFDPGNVNTAETPITTGEGTDTTAVDSTDGESKFTTSHLPTTTSTTGAGGNIGKQSCLQLETPRHDKHFNNFTERLGTKVNKQNYVNQQITMLLYTQKSTKSSSFQLCIVNLKCPSFSTKKCNVFLVNLVHLVLVNIGGSSQHKT